MYVRSTIPHRIRTDLSLSKDGIKGIVIETRVNKMPRGLGALLGHLQDRKK